MSTHLTDIEPGELVVARKDETERPCEACAEPGATAVDRRWLCTLCAADYLRSLEGERPAHWEQIRSTGLGGSDAGVLIGVDPYRDLFDLVMQKRGVLPLLPPSERMLAGSFLERGILDFYAWKTGRRYRYVNVTYRHPAIPIMLATPDALCLDERRGIDAKLTSFDQSYMWRDGPPAHIEAQAQWYMRFYDFPVWDIARWNGSDLDIYTIEADREIQDALLHTGLRAWDRYIAGDEMPPIGTSDGCARYLKEHYPENKRPLRDATDDEEALLAEYAMAHDQHKAATAERARLEAQLKLAIGDADGLYSRLSRAKFTWKKTADATKYNWPEVANVLLARLPKEERDGLLEEFTEKEPGVRRIHWTPPKA